MALYSSWLAWWDSFRTMDWEHIYPEPECVLKETSALLALAG